ncbi:MAG: SRPBCC family protein [Gemmobacter sp.]|nr:SRPBCC family protein [Gemmobacter sp.]
MKFTAREDIEAPIAEVFAALTNYDGFERAAMRRGAEVVRETHKDAPSWQVAFTYRGKQRRLSIRQVTADPPGTLRFSASATSVEGELAVDIVELGRRRTRMTVVTEVKPRTLAARLFLQSLKLARGKVTRRYQTRVAQLAKMIEDKLRPPSSLV